MYTAVRKKYGATRSTAGENEEAENNLKICYNNNILTVLTPKRAFL